MKKPQTLKEWQFLIRKQIKLIKKESFAKLIIHCSLIQIRKEYGKNRVDYVISKLSLRELGFRFCY